MASVIGRSFLYRLLEAIATAEQQLDQQLSQLQRVDLVREKNRLPELEYIFKHSLTQEATYNSLLMEQRREFHRQVGEALENLFSDRIEQYLGLLAHHFESAGDFAKAVGYLIKAGDRARLTDEHTEAISYYLRAVKLLEVQHEETRLAQIWLKLGLIYNANFQFETAHQANEKAFALQQKIIPQKQPARTVKPYMFRFGFTGAHVNLDPGLASWGQDVATSAHLFSGLAYINEELDVVPAVARSWQVLDNGKRYIFHLRNDAAWTDGTPVTAGDFEWAWKRNLHPDLHSGTAEFLFDVHGAREYHEGVNRDPASVGVCAVGWIDSGGAVGATGGLLPIYRHDASHISFAGEDCRKIWQDLVAAGYHRQQWSLQPEKSSIHNMVQGWSATPVIMVIFRETQSRWNGRSSRMKKN